MSKARMSYVRHMVAGEFREIGRARSRRLLFPRPCGIWIFLSVLAMILSRGNNALMYFLNDYFGYCEENGFYSYKNRSWERKSLQ